MASTKTVETLLISTVTQFVRDNIVLSIISTCGNLSFHSMGMIKVLSPIRQQNHLSDRKSCQRVTLIALEIAIILKAAKKSFIPKTITL